MKRPKNCLAQPLRCLTLPAPPRIRAAFRHGCSGPANALLRLATDPMTPIRFQSRAHVMKIRNSLKSLKDRHRDNRVIRRRGRTYVINKTNRRFKARQG